MDLVGKCPQVMQAKQEMPSQLNNVAKQPVEISLQESIGKKTRN